MSTQTDKSQEGPYRAAWENGFCVVRDANAPEGNKIMMMFPDDMHWLADRLNAAYTAGQESQPSVEQRVEEIMEVVDKELSDEGGMILVPVSEAIRARLTDLLSKPC